MVSFVQKDRLTFFIKNAFIPIYPVSTIYSSQIDNDIISKKNFVEQIDVNIF